MITSLPSSSMSWERVEWMSAISASRALGLRDTFVEIVSIEGRLRGVMSLKPWVFSSVIRGS